MPEDKRKKGKHLTPEDRYEIQKGLRERRTFTEIALSLVVRQIQSQKKSGITDIINLMMQEGLFRTDANIGIHAVKETFAVRS